MDFMKLVKEKLKLLHVDDSLLQRSVNEGFSGGEKKRNEIFHMAVLEPTLALLDETDSGLDIDALRSVSEGVNAMRSPDRAFIVVTHYQRLLNYIVPDFVHVLSDGKIVRSGGRELALELEEKGYAGQTAAGARQVMETMVQAPAWVKERRETAAKRFAEVGFPTTRQEDWRFTNIAPIADAKFALASGSFAQAASLIASVNVPGAVRLAIVNGQFAAGLVGSERAAEGPAHCRPARRRARRHRRPRGASRQGLQHRRASVCGAQHLAARRRRGDLRDQPAPSSRRRFTSWW